MSEPERDPEKIKNEFFAALGYAINRWAYIERDLFEIFRVLLNTGSDAKAAYLFYKSQTISYHFAMTNVIVKLSPNKVRLRKWNKIEKAFNSLISFRNRLAHDPSTRIVHAHGFIGRPPKELPPLPSDIWEIYEENAKFLFSKKQQPDPRITLTHIQEHIKSVELLLQDTQNFRMKLPKRLRKLRSR